MCVYEWWLGTAQRSAFMFFCHAWRASVSFANECNMSLQLPISTLVEKCCCVILSLAIRREWVISFEGSSAFPPLWWTLALPKKQCLSPLKCRLVLSHRPGSRCLGKWLAGWSLSPGQYHVAKPGWPEYLLPFMKIWFRINAACTILFPNVFVMPIAHCLWMKQSKWDTWAVTEPVPLCGQEKNPFSPSQ